VEDAKRKKGLLFDNSNTIYQSIFIGFKLTKQNDEKKEKGAAQIIIPTNLIFAGRISYLFRLIFN